jgi:hypothetical protein
MQKSPTNKSTILNDPFGSVIPEPEQLLIPESADAETTTVTPTSKSPRSARVVNADRRKDELPFDGGVMKRGKQKLTVHLESELADRVRNAAYWNPKLTIARIAEHGIKSAIEKYEREHGGKYPPREGELVGGRPIK